MSTKVRTKLKKCKICKKHLSVSKFRIQYNRHVSYCSKCANQNTKEWRIKNPDYHKNHSCVILYGITYKEKEQLLKFQKRKCAICNKKVAGKEAQLDHDHKSKQIRLILCTSCNLAIGKFQDKPELLYRAAEYLSCYK